MSHGIGLARYADTVRTMARSGVVLVLVCCCLTFCSGQWAIDDDGCRTPDKGFGTCVTIPSCKPYLDALKTLKRPIPAAIVKKLQAYQCGTDSRGGAKVCCPSGPIALALNNNEPVDVSNHRNVNLLPEQCGMVDTNNRIINGENAAFNEFPWMALIAYTGKKGIEFNCGGSIISKNYILTAAHCITNLAKPMAYVRVGEYSIKNETDCVSRRNKKPKCNPPVQDVNIMEVVPHPEFNIVGFSNDIGLLRVATIDFTQENAKPVCLPITAAQRTAKYINIIVTGWGVTNVETGETADILQRVGLPVSDWNNCLKTYSKHNLDIKSSQICAGGTKKKDSCGGDSGGPMVIPTVNEESDTIYLQQGIVSFGPKYCGIEGYPGVYTLVIYYMDWILNSMKP